MFWIFGPPPGRGRWWVYFHPLNGGSPRVDIVDVSPALIHADNPTAPLLVKFSHGVAYPFEQNLDRFSHHMPLEVPCAP
jgi:hypothetical protein